MFIDLTQTPDDLQADSELRFAGMWHKRRRFMAQRRRIERAFRKRARKMEKRTQRQPE